jgi:hypothetical protein
MKTKPLEEIARERKELELKGEANNRPAENFIYIDAKKCQDKSYLNSCRSPFGLG